ncbi:MAG: pyridoxal phosphate-dependent aminotransferase [Spirochaetota bacterium]
MAIQLSERTKAIQASPIRKIFDMASKMTGLTRLEVGQPDFKTPKYILDATKEMMNDGFIGYSPTNGLPQTRAAVAERYKTDYDVEYDPNTQVVITHGASGALHLALRALVNPGDEVLRPDPGFASYDGIVKDADGVPVLYPLLPEKNFAVDFDALEKLITPKTKVIMLNSPSNPTGGVLDYDQLVRINELAEKHDLYILSDEAYDKVIFDQEHVPTAKAAKDPSRVITVGSASKDYAMCGWRIGFAAGAPEIIAEIVKFQSLANICPNILAQKAYEVGLTGPQDDTEAMRKEYQRRRDYFVAELNKIPGFKCPMPDGAFYVFVDISEHNPDDWAFAETLIKEAKITCIPGSSFGPTGKGFIRFSYATSVDVLKAAIQKLNAQFGK